MGTLDLKKVTRSPVETAGWAVLGLLLLATFVGALRLDRSKFPLIGDEATYGMQAASLAWDFDLAYSRGDYDRFVAQWGVPPEGLILQNRPGSDRLVYGKPPLYALVIAPFVRVSPVRGPVVANALLLAAAALLAARALCGRLGPAAPLWVAAWVFASVAFAQVFWGDADLFLFAVVAIAFALIYGEDRRQAAPAQVYQGEDTEPGGRFLARWLGAGALLGVAVAYRPVYLVLLLPALLAAREAPVGRGRRAVTGVMSGAVLLLLASMGTQWLAGGDATGYGGQRQGIYARESYPEVEYPAAQWSRRVEREGNASWLQAAAVKPQLNPKLAGWNVLYTLAGRNVGLLPYFLPLFLGFLAFQGDRGRWVIPLAVGAALLAFLVLRPFNFYGGGALGNRYFLPLYPALWFLAARPARAAWALAAALLAAVFLWPLWIHPTAYPVGENGEYRHVSSIAQRWLPYEITQSAAPGTEVSVGSGLWVKILSHNVWATGKGGLRVAGAAEGTLLVGSPQPLGDLHLEFDGRAPSRLVVGGREFRPLMLRPDGSLLFEVPLERERAVHPLWWGPYDYHLYALVFHLPGAPAAPIGFRVLPPRDLIQRR